MKLSGALAPGLTALGLLALPAACLASPPFTFQSISLPGVEVQLPALYRPALIPPVRYRIVFIPGSGCASMQPIAERYFRGALHAEVLVLQKPDITPPGQPCTPEFIQRDSLSNWTTLARNALKAAGPGNLPQLLVGASEGGEILPHLAPHTANLRGLVLISSSGLDPRQALALQAQQLGADDAYRELTTAVASSEDGMTLHQGRTVRYWRDLWNWRVTEPLLSGSVPVLQVWGDADRLIPAAAYRQFADRVAEATTGNAQPPHICMQRLAGADHGLQSPTRDGVQWLWARLENWARAPETGLCSAFTDEPVQPESNVE